MKLDADDFIPYSALIFNIFMRLMSSTLYNHNYMTIIVPLKLRQAQTETI